MPALSLQPIGQADIVSVHAGDDLAARHAERRIQRGDDAAARCGDDAEAAVTAGIGIEDGPEASVEPSLTATSSRSADVCRVRLSSAAGNVVAAL